MSLQKNESDISSEDLKESHKKSVAFGDNDNNNNEAEELLEELHDATWGDVYQACCIHTASEWAWIFLGLMIVFFFLYFFMFSLEVLGSSAKVLTGCSAGALFGDDTNPVAGVMVGIICTVLLQSSSTTTSIIISLTGSVITLNQGIYMIMGANIGTTVTNTLVAIGQMGNQDQLEKAFAGATVHDMFNYLTVAVLFPVELITGYLNRVTGLMVKNANTEKGDEWEGPVKKFVAPLGERIIKSNSKLIRGVAAGTQTCEEGGGFYPIICEPGEPTYESCSRVGLIACLEDQNKCPAFFQVDATASDDKVSGGVMFFLAICMLFVCLGVLVSILSKMLGSLSSRVIYKATDLNGYVAMVIGCAVTVLVQSSSVTTSAMTPLVGIGALRLEQMYPLTLGANIGTTITGLLAAMVTTGTTPLQVALAHLLFNITGIAIYYPIPFMRQLPLTAARFLGRMTQLWRGFPFVYILFAFFLIPLGLLGLSFTFQSGSKGMIVLGSFLTVVLVLFLGWLFYNLKYRGGYGRMIAYFAERERRRLTYLHLPDDMSTIKDDMSSMKEQLAKLVKPEESENHGEDVEEAAVPAEDEEF